MEKNQQIQALIIDCLAQNDDYYYLCEIHEYIQLQDSQLEITHEQVKIQLDQLITEGKVEDSWAIPDDPEIEASTPKSEVRNDGWVQVYFLVKD